ncbi:hypothetical protein HBB16_07355 [Pseudonocardia sp. MCCB 268]|nr:hypothetical protein [Pseudonocardia cytotoxica]
MLQTIRSHDQFNTTVYGLDDRYRGVYRAGGCRSSARSDPRRASAGPTVTTSTSCPSDDYRAPRPSVWLGRLRHPKGCGPATIFETNPLILLTFPGPRVRHPDLEVGGRAAGARHLSARVLVTTT